MGQVDYRTVLHKKGICLKVNSLPWCSLHLTVVLVLNTLLLNAVVGLISILAVYELLSAQLLLSG